MGIGIRIYADRKLTVWERLKLSVNIAIRGEGQFLDSQCRIVYGVTGVQEAQDEARAAAEQAVDTVVDRVNSITIPPS